MYPPNKETPGLDTIEHRVKQVEEHVKEQRELNSKINEGLWAIRAAMEKGLGELSSRIKDHDDRRDRVRKWVLGIVGALAVGLICYLAKISMIVQAARVTNGG